MASLALHLFGPFRATLDGQEATDFATDKARALLAYLAVESGRPHRRDTLAGLLWPDAPQENARQGLRQTLNRVRQAIAERDRDPPLLRVQRDRVQFDAAGDAWLDVAAFTAIMADCQAHRHRDIGACRPCLEQLQRAVELYQGDFLDQFFLPDSAPFEEWALLTRDRLRQQALGALALLSTYHERRGDYDQARQYAWRQVRLAPWCEEAHQQLIRILALTGSRSAALAQYESCRRALAEALGVDPLAETVALYEQIRDGVPLQAPPPCHSLPPPPGPLVGRDKELSELSELLSNPDVRLVTLVGPGGIGKTRLALQAAADQVGTFAHGVHFVSLAAAGTVESVALDIAAALWFSLHGREEPRQQLLAYLREKELLLVLDSMEHLLEASGLLVDILRQAPGVVLLVTSRERLKLREEWVYTVQGLDYPSSAREIAAGYGAVALFAQSARRARHDFNPQDEADQIVRICQLVDGVPLGIELAAAWVGTHTCMEVATAIARNLDILISTLSNVPERHRSMRATFAHSWNLLDGSQQRVFRSLAVFRAGFQAEAAEPVTGAAPMDLVALQDKSLLSREATGRYQLHELLRQYAAEQLAASAEQEEALDRHCAYFTQYLHDREQRLQGREQEEALADIAAEIENVRAAWQRAAAAGKEAEISAALGGLDLFYELQSWYHEGYEAFALAAQGLQAHGLDGLALERVRLRQARFASRLGQNEPARQQLARSLEFFRASADRQELVLAANLLAEVHAVSGDYAAAGALLHDALAVGEDMGDAYVQAGTLVNLGDLAAHQGEFAAARDYWTRGLALSRTTGAPLREASALSNLGRIAAIMGDYAEAGELFQSSLAIYRELGNRQGMAGCLNNLGSLAYLAEDYVQARRLRQETLAICQEIGFRWGVANTLKNLGDIARRMGRPEEARRSLVRALSTQREMGDLRAQANTLNSLGSLDLDQGHLDQAGQHFRRALALANEAGAWPVVLDVLNGVAAIQAARGLAVEALELTAFVLAHPASEQQTLDRAKELRGGLVAQVPPEKAATAEARGQAGRLEDVVARIHDGTGR